MEDPLEDIEGAASSPLLLNMRGGGDEVGEEEQNQDQQEVVDSNITTRLTEFSHDDSIHTSATRCSSGWWRKIPTLACILIPTALIFIGMFLASAFMPHTVHTDDEKNEKEMNSTNSSTPPLYYSKLYHDEKKLAHDGLHADPIRPTLLGIRDPMNGNLIDVHTNQLYVRTLQASFHMNEEASSSAIGLQSDKDEVGYGDSLTLKWNNTGHHQQESSNQDDIIALYCNEVNPKRFLDVATIAHIRATHDHNAKNIQSQGRNLDNNNNIWTIPSFPIVREASCEFRMYAHSTKEEEHHYTFMGATSPISLNSNQDPTGIHISLTGHDGEMNIQFATGESGVPYVEIAKKGDDDDDTPIKVKGESTSYAADDMCQEPATSTEPGYFIDPGHLHTVKVANLLPNTEYGYRIGLGFGQGIKWNDDTHTFRTSAPRGVGSTTKDKPALTFLAVADLGAEGAFEGPDKVNARNHNGPSDYNNVAQLMTSIVNNNNQTIDSIHLIGDLSYANGAGHIWDAFMNLIQPYAKMVPTMVGIGNHEYDHTDGGGGGKDPSHETSPDGYQPSWGAGLFNLTPGIGGECGVPVNKRFAAPENGNGVFWYSFEQSLVHTVMLSSEHNMTIGSEQYNWLERDLSAVNRSITPWLVVELHRPIYNSEFHGLNWKQPLVQTGFQDAIEDILFAHKVDLVIGGHYHSYFRSCDGLYAHKCGTTGGPTYITVGTGGAPLDGEINQIIDPNHITESFDRSKWGVGRASVYNASTIHWEFVAVGGDIFDEVWLKRAR